MAAGDPGSPARYYSSIAVETSLGSSIPAQSQGQSNTSFIVGSVSGFPSSYPYTLLVDPDTSKEEVVTVTAGSGTTLTVTRGSDNTQAVAHSAGAVVRHGVSGRDFRDTENHIAARGYDTDESILTAAGQTHVHGLQTGDGVVVGTTKSQTLTNKTYSAGTFTGSFTASAATFVSPTISGTPVITGLSSVGMTTSSATPKSYVDSILGSATSAAVSAASAAVSATSAATSATSAANSATAAATSASAAVTSATSAAASATAAATSATSSSASATLANDWATLTSGPVAGGEYSAKYNAQLSAASATSAATSATSAANSATAAAASVATIASYATAAANSATAAATSATSAAASATAAATSAASAAASYSSVVNQTGSGIVRDMGDITDPDTTTGTYVSIVTLTDQATTAATAAGTSATSAAASATAAATSASSASASATAAATSATSAAASATAAATSATSAAASATAAATSAASAAAAVTTAIQASIIDAKGDLIVGSAADTAARLAVGTNGYILMADSAEASGVKWAAPNPGDITGVTAGTGLTGGGTSGDVTVALDTTSAYVVPSQTGNNGYFLSTNGSSASWVNLYDWGTI